MAVRPAGLDVLAYLPNPLLAHLRVVLAGSPGHVLTVADRWDGFAESLRVATADVVVIDPCADGICRAASLVGLLESGLSLPVIVYTPVSPASFQAIAELSRHSPHHAAHHVVLHRYDDEPRRFLDLLERQPGTSLTTALLEELSPTLSGLQPALARAVERLLRRPTEFHDVSDLAKAARLNVRTTYRQLVTAGLTSPRALIVAARLLQAYGYARDPRQSLAAIAERVGYSAPRMLTKHMREVIGSTPRAVRRQMRPAEFVHALAQWLSPDPLPTALLAQSRLAVAAQHAQQPWARGDIESALPKGRDDAVLAAPPAEPLAVSLPVAPPSERWVARAPQMIPTISMSEPEGARPALEASEAVPNVQLGPADVTGWTPDNRTLGSESDATRAEQRPSWLWASAPPVL